MSTEMKEETSLDEEVSSGEAFLLGEKTPRTIDEMIRRYQDNVYQFGFSGRTLLYPDDTFHKTKLEKYVSLLKKAVQNGDSLLDIGCGYGSLVEQLFRFTSCTYRGIDVVSEFIEHAQEVYRGKEHISFAKMDLKQYKERNEEKVDWCVLLGVLNSVPYPNNLVEQAWESCKKGLFFDINSIEKKNVTRYNTFHIAHYIALFEGLGATVESSRVWDGCIILKVSK